MRDLHYSVVMKRELSKQAKFSIFKTFFVPILTYGHESWIITGRAKASKMMFLRRIEEVTLVNKVRRSETRKSMNIEPLQYFSELKALSLEKLKDLSLESTQQCKQNDSGKTSETSFTFQVKWEKTNCGRHRTRLINYTIT